MRTFDLVRYRDPSRVSGVGVVASGVVFVDGSVALRWAAESMPHSTSVWDSLDDLLKVHGHDGATVARFHDGDES